MSQPINTAAFDLIFYATLADVAAGPIIAAVIIYLAARLYRHK